MAANVPPSVSSGFGTAMTIGAILGFAAGGVGYWLGDIPGMVVGLVVGDAVGWLLWWASRK